MKNDLGKYPQLLIALEENKIVYIFGTGISGALTGASYSWYKWIIDGMNSLNNKAFVAALENNQILMFRSNFPTFVKGIQGTRVQLI